MSALKNLRLTDRVSARIASRMADDSDAGMTTAEYAVGTVAACGSAGVLYKFFTSEEFKHLIIAIVKKAFHLSF